MYPPIFEICAADPAVQSFLGTNPTRLYPFGEAEQAGENPYAVWQTISGFPENYMSNRPDIDSYTLQVDVYAIVATETRQIAKAIRDAVEDYAHIVAWRGEFRDRFTNNYRYSFDIDWLVSRI